MTRPTILILIGAFWPGHESSGPNLSIKAQCEALSDRFDFRIIARNGPFGGKSLDDGMAWRDLGWAQARYLPVSRTGAVGLARHLRETPHDLLVLNGFFDREFTIPALVARRLRRGSKAPVLISPRGEFTGGALSLKSGRKAGYLQLASVLNLLDGVHIHATSDAEAADSRVALPGLLVTLAPNSRPLFALPPHDPGHAGGPLRLAFVGRISPVKGLDFALDVLAGVTSPVRFEIYGPVSDEAHWQACLARVSTLPPQIEVVHRGAITNAEVPAVLAQHDALFLPSLSENFGHSMFESLASGTPLVIGDQTPWRDLAAKRAGFDLPVRDAGAFRKALETLAAMPKDERRRWRAGARAYAEAFARDNDAAAKMAALFETMIGSR